MPRLRLGMRVNLDDPLDPEAGLSAFIQAKELFQHVLQLGKSGTGKSAWILNVCCTLMACGIAVLLIEPAGFLARDVYAASRRRAKYCSLQHPIGVNPMMLPYPPPVVSSIVRESIDQVVALATHGANKSLTVKMSALIDTAVTTCLERGDHNLSAVQDEIKQMKENSETKDGITSRLQFLLSDTRMRQILCGPGTIDIARLARDGQSFILNCEGMSAEGMTFVGNLTTQAVKSYLRYSGRISFDALAIVIDEAHNFVSQNWTPILKEGRKYNLAAILATQDLASFPEAMRRILLNVGTIVAARLGAAEASCIARELHVSVETLQFLEKYVIAFNTPSTRGFAKTPYPPLLPKIEPPINKAIPQELKASRPSPPPPTINSEPMPKINWFPLQPFPPPQTSISETVPVDAHGAETPPSTTVDGKLNADGDFCVAGPGRAVPGRSGLPG